MADDRPEDSGPSPDDVSRPKRAPPTIDLQASEVPREPPTPESLAEVDATPEIDATPDAAPPSKASGASAILAAVSGAIAAAFVVGAAWWLGWTGSATPSTAVVPQVNSAAIDSLTARVATVESKVVAPPAAAAAGPDPAITSRIDTIEKTVASLRDQSSLIRARTETLAAELNDAKSASRAAAATPDLTALNERLTEMERTIQSLRAETAVRSATPADDRALRRLVAASLLDNSVRQGEPYAAALTVAKQLAADASVLKPLDVFATSGVLSASALARELLALLPKLSSAQAKVAGGSGILDRLEAGAARLVRIQRTDAADGNDRDTTVTRAAAAARKDDVVNARHELMTLAPADRTAAQSWIEKTDAREAAFDASRKFAADALAALSKPAP